MAKIKNNNIVNFFYYLFLKKNIVQENIRSRVIPSVQNTITSQYYFENQMFIQPFVRNRTVTNISGGQTPKSVFQE